jgi:ribosomal protein L11 methyltransferase
LKWLELTLSLSGEIAEAAVEVISRYAPNSIALEYPLDGSKIDPNAQAVIHAYLEPNEELEGQRRAIEEGLWHLSQIEPFPEPEFRWIEEQQWEDAWKEHYQPIKIGEKLLIQPAWLPVQESHRIPIIMDPGMAFGTGTHPSTQLCLLALEKHLTKDQKVVDLGCGSGILSIAAVHLGASEVLALDIDANAVRVAQENVEVNSVGHALTIRQGSLETLLTDLGSQTSSTHLLVANILAKVLIDFIQHGLDKAIKPGGLLILSGILDHQVEEMMHVAQGHNLDPLETYEILDWRALVLKRKSPQ